MARSIDLGIVGLVIFLFVVLLIGMLMNGPLRIEGFQKDATDKDKCKDTNCEYPETCNPSSGKCEPPK